LPVQPNRQYNVAAPASLAVRVATWQRRRMFARFVADAGVGPLDTILDVGVTSDRSYASSNYLEAWCDNKERIVAAGVDDASFLERDHPGVRFVYADGLKLPFADRAFDVVHSSAVIEHVGSAVRQAAFIRECARVARRAVFVTTPNRWFPIEFHTVLPLVHWLPKTAFRGLMRRTGRAFFADEANLNLLSRAQLRRLAAGVEGYAFDVASVALLGWPSNLLLIGRRVAATITRPRSAPP
jgi:ubiquinone/menaquinone biosynthesis C-methylase UbiE